MPATSTQKRAPGVLAAVTTAPWRSSRPPRPIRSSAAGSRLCRLLPADIESSFEQLSHRHSRRAPRVRQSSAQRRDAMTDSNNGAPPYCRTELFLEREVVVGEGEWALPATLTCPKASMPAPGVVLVHGSGPNDRDGTSGPNKVFRDLAWGLA